ncbi:MAG: toll/interleukin-1 receptor domain-containing protein [Bacteroidetes bacterium]|nr:toll/interleukin-1 receptor domain-containing protein [Bacteroidota bacterium]
MFSARIFISYDRRDQAQAREICEFIRDCGCIPLIDYEAILPGDRWRRKSMEQLQESQAVVLVISPHSVHSSRTVYEEFQLAMELAQQDMLEVIPICIMPVSLPPELASYHTGLWNSKGKSSLRRKVKKIAADYENGLLVGGVTLASLVAGGIYWWKSRFQKKPPASRSSQQKRRPK